MILMHELNDYTMDMAMKYYPKLKESFRVSIFVLLLSPIRAHCGGLNPLSISTLFLLQSASTSPNHTSKATTLSPPLLNVGVRSLTFIQT